MLYFVLLHRRVFPDIGKRFLADRIDIARILSLRPEVKYIPVFMTGMGRSLPKGKMILLPYKASVYYGIPTLVKSTDTHEILDQITGDFEVMKEKYQVVIDEEEE